MDLSSQHVSLSWTPKLITSIDGANSALKILISYPAFFPKPFSSIEPRINWRFMPHIPPN
jgi:hypothetical protein